ncbi:amidohydrolase family protein [Mycolicibacterium sp.]|uniref:amidohydrolase family protein n=1 Tax=Mycolicibacterium sp. TaxID=2320850 RepID=UPI001A2093AF|nr:amidohydrolase family protein [Mycolicibacterium sp.]MBJ7336781.1 amidohydrolase family protein [Mycolicibacterium sp.]
MSVPQRFFDAHVHFWDPACRCWYPFLAPDAVSAVGLGTATGMKRRYDAATYRSDAASVVLDGVVHVTAARGSGNYLAETESLAKLRSVDGLPTALVGGFDPAASLAVIEAELDAQAREPAFVGVRTMEPLDYSQATTDAVLGLVAERGLVFDVVTHPDEMATVAETLETHPSVTFVVEHTGWPLVADDATHTRAWRAGMQALAASGTHVYCKLSGLAMTLHTFDTEALRPWIEYAIDVFGVDRCLFGSNFPVDAMFGTFADLIQAYATITAPLGAQAQAKLFSGNTRAVYASGPTTIDR